MAVAAVDSTAADSAVVAATAAVASAADAPTGAGMAALIVAEDSLRADTADQHIAAEADTVLAPSVATVRVVLGSVADRFRARVDAAPATQPVSAAQAAPARATR
jgi:hypothetical protein